MNIVESGRTPVLPPQTLEAMGFAIAICPAIGLVAGQALQGVYSHLLDKRTSIDAPVPLHGFMAFSRLMGFEAMWDFDKRHAR